MTSPGLAPVSICCAASRAGYVLVHSAYARWEYKSYTPTSFQGWRKEENATAVPVEVR